MPLCDQDNDCGYDEDGAGGDDDDGDNGNGDDDKNQSLLTCATVSSGSR